jgi:transposase
MGHCGVLIYAMRRVDCPTCGITVEKVPWANGKERTTLVYAWFLASWAKVMSWQEVARRFRTSWDTVFRSVEAAVTWGLAHRCLDGIRAIGVDELAWKKRHKYLTVVYQLDHGCKRLLWIGKDRTKQTFQAFFDFLGEARAQSIAFIVSDTWRALLSVVAARASAAVHVLDRFHVEQLLHKVLDTVRRQEVRALRAKGTHAVLTKTRWLLLLKRRTISPGHRPDASASSCASTSRAFAPTSSRSSSDASGAISLLPGLDASSIPGLAWPCALASSRSRPPPRLSESIATSYSTGSALAKPSPRALSKASITKLG